MVKLDSLKTRLTLSSVGVTLVVLALTYVALTVATSRTAAARAGKNTTELSSAFSASVAEAVAVDDKLQILLVCRAFEENGLAAIRLYGRDGGVIYASDSPLLETLKVEAGDPLAGEAAGERQLLTHSVDGTDYLVARQPVHFRDTPVGAVETWLDKTEVERSLESSTFSVYPVVFIGLLAMVFLVFVNLYAPFRTLRHLGVAAERIGSGHLDERVPVHGADEMATFCRVFNGMAGDLERARDQSTESHLETIHAMINVVEAKDRYTVGHCLRVGGLARQIVMKLDGISNREIFLVEAAAILHDIGKIGIPDRVLLKRESLTPEEEEIIRTHVIVGDGILRRMHSMRDIAKWVRHHHERWDGKGYPDGLTENAIPLASRIITVADAIDAMMTDRPYRKGFNKKKVIEIIREAKGRQFEPRIANLAIEVLETENVEMSASAKQILGRDDDDSDRTLDRAFDELQLV